MSGGIDWNEISKNANGGTELLCRELEKRIPADLLSNFQIIPSRVMNPLQEDKIRILWCHDLAEDPSAAHLQHDWHMFHKIVFVSNHQMQEYIKRHHIPWEKCVVIHNAINMIEEHEKPKGPIKLCYTSTPQRGLHIASRVFDKLCEKHDDIEFHVFSSFAIYGWNENDKQFEPVFEELKKNPKVSYYGSVPNEELRERLKEFHVFAYPSIWQETSCLCLMEAMSAGLVCVHPNLGALYETAAGWTMMYQYREDQSQHASTFYSVLDHAINVARDGSAKQHLQNQRHYSSIFHNWEHRQGHWQEFLESLLNEPREMGKHPDEGLFVYRTT